MRAGDAGWLGKHLLPGIAGGFNLGILQLGDMDGGSIEETTLLLGDNSAEPSGFM